MHSMHRCDNCGHEPFVVHIDQNRIWECSKCGGMNYAGFKTRMEDNVKGDVILKMENIQRAYENGCSDVRKALKDLIPELRPEPKDVTAEIEFKLEKNYNGDAYVLRLYHKGSKIGHHANGSLNSLRGFKIRKDQERNYSIKHVREYGIKIFKLR